MKTVWVFACGILLIACASKEETLKPNPLPSIEAEVTFKKLWKKRVGASHSDQLSLLVPGVGQEQVVVVSPSGQMTALSLLKGKKQWRIKLSESVAAGVSVDEQHVYVGLESGVLAAYSLQTGEALWQLPLGAEMVVPAQAQRGLVVAHTINGKVHLLRAQSGEREWVYDSVSPALTLRGAAQPIIAGPLVMAGFSNGKLAALDLKTGLLRWERALGTAKGRSELDRLMDLDSGFWLGDGVLAAGSYQGRVALLELTQGRPLWSRELSSYVGITGSYDGLFVVDEQSVVWHLALESGRTVWQQPELTARQLTACAVIEGYCVAGDFEGYLHVFDQSTGRLVGRTRFSRHPIKVAPLVYDNTLYVLSSSGHIAAYILNK